MSDSKKRPNIIIVGSGAEGKMALLNLERIKNIKSVFGDDVIILTQEDFEKQNTDNKVLSNFEHKAPLPEIKSIIPEEVKLTTLNEPKDGKALRRERRAKERRKK